MLTSTGARRRAAARSPSRRRGLQTPAPRPPPGASWQGGLAAAIMALDSALADWLAALVVALILGVIAALLALTGLKSVRRATPPIPKETVDSVKEDVAWVKTQAKSGIK